MKASATGTNSSDDAALFQKLKRLCERGQSELCEVRRSGIHGNGVYATQHIATHQPIIEYVGERITKQESERRGHRQAIRAKRSGGAAVYIFTLSKRFDLDGDFPWNTARLINHSCAPNCEAWHIGRKIIIHALREIAADEELTFDYGFEVDCYEDHPCRCGAPECVGYIVSRSQWPELRNRLHKVSERNDQKSQ